MPIITIAGSDYDLPPHAAKFLRDYLARVSSYVTSHSLDIELAQDIESRLAEQLDAHLARKKKLTSEDVVTIVNAIGEPEDIFGDEARDEPLVTPRARAAMDKLGDLIRRAWDRLSTDRPLIFGLCAWLGQTTKIPALIYRLVFLIGGLTNPIFIIGYIGLSLVIFGGKQVARSSETIRRTATGASRGFAGAFGGGISFLAVSFVTLIRFAFFTLLALTLLGLAGSTLVAGAAAMSEWTIGNQILLAAIPTYAKWSLLALTLVGVTLAVGAIGRAVSRSWLPRFAVFIAILVGVAGIFGVAAGGFQTVGQFAEHFSREEQFSFPVAPDAALTVDGLDTLTPQTFVELPMDIDVELRHTTSGPLALTFTSEIAAASPAAADTIFAALTPIDVTQTGDHLTVRLTDKSLFTQPTPYAMLRRRLTVDVPADVRVTFANADEMQFADLAQPVIEGRTLDVRCPAYPLGYDTTREVFTCFPPADIIDAEIARWQEMEETEQREREEYLRDRLDVFEEAGVKLGDDAVVASITWQDATHATAIVRSADGLRAFRLEYTTPGPRPDRVEPSVTRTSDADDITPSVPAAPSAPRADDMPETASR